jgi:hypothetical protein
MAWRERERERERDEKILDDLFALARSSLAVGITGKRESNDKTCGSLKEKEMVLINVFFIHWARLATVEADCWCQMRRISWKRHSTQLLVVVVVDASRRSDVRIR